MSIALRCKVKENYGYYFSVLGTGSNRRDSSVRQQAKDTIFGWCRGCGILRSAVFEMQNLKVLQDSFKKSEILQILEMLHFKIIQIFRLLT